ncbi:MAG: glycosyltransferase [Acidobacteria bacterium]|nr:glycosyltransferase [Acidobacteriota bacterium]
MRIAVLTPLPPVRSGIAGYCALLLPHLARRTEVVAVVEQESWEALRGVEVIRFDRFDAREFDAVIGQLGNNPYHEFIYDEAMRAPLHAVLHDLVLHHLIVEKTLARGDAASYEEAIRASHGIAGASFARGRAHGFHAELGNFLFPGSADLARYSRSVIVHNRWAAERLREQGVRTPIVVVGHPYEESEPLPAPGVREAMRERLGFTPGERVIGMFGFVTGSKRPEAVFEAFARARKNHPSLRLLVVGSPAPNVDLEALAAAWSLPRDSWKATGWVDDADFDAWLAAVDRIVNLRYPSAGEMSGPLIRAFRIGRPVAVSAVAQFAEIPEPAVAHIPPMQGEIDDLARFMTAELDAEQIAAAQKRWLEANASTASVVDGYFRALEGGNDVGDVPAASLSALPLLPSFRIERLEGSPAEPGSWRVALAVVHEGPALLRNPVYGEPALRFVLKAFDGERVVADRWLAPAGDLEPGGRFETVVDLVAEGKNLRFTLEPAVANLVR